MDRFCWRKRMIMLNLLAEALGYERRNGYNWLSDWPAKLLAKEYPAWKARVSGARGN
jgi:hypothetical protein